MTDLPQSLSPVTETLPEWEDADVQLVYEMLCDPELNSPPNPEEHWEGWVSRNIVRGLRSRRYAQCSQQWRTMESAPKDREILARRHNDVCHEHYVVWWTGDKTYPWQSENTAYPDGRLDEWCEIPRTVSDTSTTREGK